MAALAGRNGADGAGPDAAEQDGAGGSASAPIRRRRTDPRRRAQILEVALAVLAERGYAGASTREIAARAGASKETLYAWFGDKRGLFEALVRSQAEPVDAAVAPTAGPGPAAAPGPGAADGEPATVLRAFAVELQRLLLGERAVVLNRAAIAEAATDPTLGRILATQGRDRVLPELARYLEGQRARGRLAFDDGRAAAEALIGLAVGDQQVRRLLGVAPVPPPAEIEARADRAVHAFLTAFDAERGREGA